MLAKNIVTSTGIWLRKYALLIVLLALLATELISVALNGMGPRPQLPPRGYVAEYNDELYVLKSDYMLPVWSPDFSAGSLAYFKRINMNLFYDYSKASYKIQNSNNQEWYYSEKSYQSTGAEVRAVVHLLRFVFPFEFGYRYAYRFDDRKSYHEFLFSVNFAGYAVNGR